MAHFFHKIKMYHVKEIKIPVFHLCNILIKKKRYYLTVLTIYDVFGVPLVNKMYINNFKKNSFR